MTKSEKNSADLNFSEKENELLQRIETAILDNETESFEKSLGNIFSSRNLAFYHFKKIAALFFAIFTVSALVYYFGYPANKRLYNKFYRQTELNVTPDVLRGAEAEKNKALSLFAEKEYKQALQHFNRLNSANSTDYQNLFYAAVCNLELQNWNNADQILDSILKAETNYYTDDANWYKALLKIRNKDFEQAITYLNNIKSTSDYFSLSNELRQKISQ